MKKKNNLLRILFLAHYAPENKDELIPTDIPDKVYAIYHHWIFTFLTNEFENVLSTNDPAIIFKENIKEDVDFIFSLYNRLPFNNSEFFISSVAEYHK